MFKSKKANVITAFLLAIALWVYIFGSGASTTTKTFKDIPITTINEEVLNANGLTVLSMGTNKVSVTVSGLRPAVSAVKVDDFEVVADLKSLPHGASNITLVVNGPEEVKIDNMNYQSVDVLVDELISESKPIQVEIFNDTSDVTEPYVVQLSREKSKITGAKTYVDSVVACKAMLDATKVTDEMQAISVALTAIDENGNEVEGVEFTTPNVSITSVLLEKKTVNLVVPVVGEESERFTRTVDYPKAITIKGIKPDLAKINEVECKPLDVSELFESTTIDLEPILADGVRIASDSEGIAANVVVQKAASKTFDISSADISFTGITAKTKVNAPEIDIQAIVGGEQKAINSIKADDFLLSADLKGLGAGEHKVPLIIKSKVEVDMVKCEPSEITITIE